MKPVILLTNDDGYNSRFLKILAEVLNHHFAVRIVAPSGERSWIGKAITRKGSVRVERLETASIPTWIVDGTPADCVNIGIGNLLEGEKVEGVVSGINIGFNVSLPIILSSGTVGAALEGALFGMPAIALSQVLDKEQFEALQEEGASLTDELELTIRESSIRAVEFVQSAIDQFDPTERSVKVHNINFPVGVKDDTPIEICKVAEKKAGSIFEQDPEDENAFVFRYSDGENIESSQKTDLSCLQQGHISYSLLDYTQLSRIVPDGEKNE